MKHIISSCDFSIHISSENLDYLPFFIHRLSDFASSYSIFNFCFSHSRIFNFEKYFAAKICFSFHSVLTIDSFNNFLEYFYNNYFLEGFSNKIKVFSILPYSDLSDVLIFNNDCLEKNILEVSV